ncbi:hypothetical protein TrST_g5331 [Triparma strigata]|uniref:tryptophan--tRNA ligase n=1 Tax=Triparma strigata TaxID=1606541 RepID=A0A9W7BQE5_9STRA|nr:hypothetical protein TrST_g5331 [Triparma strigata]
MLPLLLLLSLLLCVCTFSFNAYPPPPSMMRTACSRYCLQSSKITASSTSKLFSSSSPATPTKTPPKKRVLSGVQPTGSLHLGNYLGSISQWPKMQEEYDCSFCVVDLHSLTNMPKNTEVTKSLKENTLTAAAIYIASGVDPSTSNIFVQSHVKQHAELSWLLSCSLPLNWLERMIQYKDKTATAKEGEVGTGLLTYPALMAADILLYGAEVVPVGEDQRQHLELTRDIARRFNDLYCKGGPWKKKTKEYGIPSYPVFREPTAQIVKGGARIMSLSDGRNKMSKSDPNPNSCINILDSPDVIVQKIKAAKTDDIVGIFEDTSRPEANNLMSIYDITSQGDGEDVSNMSWGEFKPILATSVVEYLKPLQKRYEEVRNEEGYLEGVLKEGKENASVIAEETVRKVKIGMGFYLD